MKLQVLGVVLSTGVVLTLSTGCNKQEDTTPVTTTNEETAPATRDAGAELKTTADTVKEQGIAASVAATQAADKAVTELKPAASQASAEADTLLAQARGYVAEKKFTEALNSLKQLSNLKLTPEQQKALEDLRQQVQAALAKAGASDAASKLGHVLGGNK